MTLWNSTFEKISGTLLNFITGMIDGTEQLAYD